MKREPPGSLSSVYWHLTARADSCWHGAWGGDGDEVAGRMTIPARAVGARGIRGFDRERAHKALDILLTVFALLVLPSLLIEAITSDDDAVWAAAGEALDWFIWIGFALTLIAIFVVVGDRRRALRTHAIDILLVLLTPPIVPQSWQALRALRVLRILRLVLAGFRLHRYSKHFTRATVVGPAAVVLAVVLLAAATVIRMVEPDRATSTAQAVWWAVSRATALGDGGVAIGTTPGRALEILVVMSGLAFLSLITAAIATVFVHSEQPTDPDKPQLREIIERLERIEHRLGRGQDGTV
jgi:voltage-gated potassium channel